MLERKRNSILIFAFLLAIIAAVGSVTVSTTIVQTTSLVITNFSVITGAVVQFPFTMHNTGNTNVSAYPEITVYDSNNSAVVTLYNDPAVNMTAGSLQNLQLNWNTSASGSFTANLTVSYDNASFTSASRGFTLSAPAPTPTPTSELTSITVSPASVSVVAGDTQNFTASPKDQSGDPIAATVAWNSSKPGVGTINSITGVFTAQAAGITIVTATSGAIASSGSTVSVIPQPTVVSVSYNLTDITTANNNNVTIVGTGITSDRPLNNSEIINLGAGNGTLVINIDVNQTDNKTGTVSSVILETPVIITNSSLNRTANINLNLNSSVWIKATPQLSLQPLNNLNDAFSGDAAVNASDDIDSGLLALGESASRKDIATFIKATLSGINSSDVKSLPIIMTADAGWYENKAGKNPNNVFLFKLNDTTGKVRDRQKPISTSPLDTVNNTYTFTFEMEGFSIFTLIASTPEIVQPAPPSGGGGDGGGGGLLTSEPYGNIAKAEGYDKSLIANTPVTYTFISPELAIYEIVVTGKENEDDVALRVEALNSTSKLVIFSPPGTVYKNVNLWAGTRRIKEALIRFKVESTWFASNNFAGDDVKMVKWDGSRWVQIETVEKTRDSKYTYYEAKTDSFSSFAITGLKGVVVPTATPAIEETITPTGAATPVPTEEMKNVLELRVILSITLVILIIITAILAAFNLSKRNRG